MQSVMPIRMYTPVAFVWHEIYWHTYLHVVVLCNQAAVFLQPEAFKRDWSAMTIPAGLGQDPLLLILLWNLCVMVLVMNSWQLLSASFGHMFKERRHVFLTIALVALPHHCSRYAKRCAGHAIWLWSCLVSNLFIVMSVLLYMLKINILRFRCMIQVNQDADRAS